MGGQVMELIRGECDVLGRRELFKMSSAMSFMRLDDFNTVQQAQLTDLVKFLDANWVGNICQHITRRCCCTARPWLPSAPLAARSPHARRTCAARSNTCVF